MIKAVTFKCLRHAKRAPQGFFLWPQLGSQIPETDLAFSRPSPPAAWLVWNVRTGSGGWERQWKIGELRAGGAAEATPVALGAGQGRPGLGWV